MRISKVLSDWGSFRMYHCRNEDSLCYWAFEHLFLDGLLKGTNDPQDAENYFHAFLPHIAFAIVMAVLSIVIGICAAVAVARCVALVDAAALVSPRRLLMPQPAAASVIARGEAWCLQKKGWLVILSPLVGNTANGTDWARLDRSFRSFSAPFFSLA